MPTKGGSGARGERAGAEGGRAKSKRKKDAISAEAGGSDGESV